MQGCAKDSTGPETLPQTLATVQAAVDMVTTGQIKIVGSCAGSVPINCPGGTLASPAYINLTRTADSVAFVVAADRYDFSATMSAVSAAGIPLTLPLVGECTLNINTAPGTAPTITLTGSVTFASQTLNGPIDRLDFSNLNLTGFDAADASITGTVACQSASISINYYIDQLVGMFQQNASLCAVPGPALLGPCPATVAASARRP